MSTATQSTVATTGGNNQYPYPPTSNNHNPKYMPYANGNGKHAPAQQGYYPPVAPPIAKPYAGLPKSTVPPPAPGDAPPPWDDADGHYIIVQGNTMGENDKCEWQMNSCDAMCCRLNTIARLLDSADKIVKLLGQGTFGKVVEAQAARAFNRVAIKIIRAVPKYREASAIEIRVLKALKENDPSNRLCVCYRVIRRGDRLGC
jgi:hypothetical protein